MYALIIDFLKTSRQSLHTSTLYTVVVLAWLQIQVTAWWKRQVYLHCLRSYSFKRSSILM